MAGSIISAAGLTRAEAEAWVGDDKSARWERLAHDAQIKIISTLTAELDAMRPLVVGDLVRVVGGLQTVYVIVAIEGEWVWGFDAQKHPCSWRFDAVERAETDGKP